MVAAPQTETELLQRCKDLAGNNVANIAEQLNIIVPTDLTRHKGWLGQLLEMALGATAKSKAEPDFESIKVELKTLPLNNKLMPKESTFICSANPPFANRWQQSLVWKKLRRVLWLPIEADKTIPLAQRRVGTGFLWSPSEQQVNVLQQDWDELTELLALGHYDQLTAKHGTYMQCRPKAANAKVIRQDIDSSGEVSNIVPRGFYLRTNLTKAILQQQQSF